MTAVWAMPAAAWWDLGLIVGVLLGIPFLLLFVLVVLDRRAGR